jgi:hypothetical protein
MTTLRFNDALSLPPPRPRRPHAIPLRLRPPLLARPLFGLPPVQEASLVGMFALGLAWGGAELALWLTIF